MLDGLERVPLKKEGNEILGIYFSSSPEYAIRYAREKSKPAIFLCYVIMCNPYPMIYDDAPSKSKLSFYGMGNYKNYLSHYVPVIPYGDPAVTIDYRPPPIGN